MTFPRLSNWAEQRKSGHFPDDGGSACSALGRLLHHSLIWFGFVESREWGPDRGPEWVGLGWLPHHSRFWPEPVKRPVVEFVPPAAPEVGERTPEHKEGMG